MRTRTEPFLGTWLQGPHAWGNTFTFTFIHVKCISAHTGTQTYLITIQTHQHTRTTGRRPRGAQRLRYRYTVHRGQSGAPTVISQ